MFPDYFIFSWGLTSYEFPSLEGKKLLYLSPKSYFQTRVIFFKILNFWAVFNGKDVHMDRNEVFGTWNLIILRICFKCMLN